MALLSPTGLHLRFGGVAALADVSFAVDPGTIHAIIGPNGAGKTSLLNCVARRLPAAARHDPLRRPAT